jgi:aspartokinase/homoserine dehydrogenase 1
MYVGDVLRDVGVVDAVSEEERVELWIYKKGHSFAQLSSSGSVC